MANADTKTRREPIVVKFEKLTFVASPLPWRKRNDLGEAIVKSYGAALQRSLTSTTKDADGNEVIDFHFSESGIAYDKIIPLAFPDQNEADFADLPFEVLVDEVLEAALVVNGLERQRYMLDMGKAVVGPSDLATASDDGPKTESSPD